MSSPIRYPDSPPLPSLPHSLPFDGKESGNDDQSSPRKRRKVLNQSSSPIMSLSATRLHAFEQNERFHLPTSQSRPLARTGKKAGFLASNSDSEDDHIDLGNPKHLEPTFFSTRRLKMESILDGEAESRSCAANLLEGGNGEDILALDELDGNTVRSHVARTVYTSFTKTAFKYPDGLSSTSMTQSCTSPSESLNLGYGLRSTQRPNAALITNYTTDSSLDFVARTSSGRSLPIGRRPQTQLSSYEQLIASRSESAPGRAQKSYYGINIHNLIDEADRLLLESKHRRETDEIRKATTGTQPQPQRQLWMEKYRARSFPALVGDERTHRHVLRWFKRWDSIVFPARQTRLAFGGRGEDDTPHRKLLLLAGPPGFGKTTLAHVCARQAGYEVGEINASDDRSANVVRTKIKDMLGTENVRGGRGKVGAPVCVVVDEVDGVAGSGGSSESGFIRALLDLVERDHANSSKSGSTFSSTSKGKGKSKEKFRMLRPLVMVCNDLYAPSLRLLRQSPHVEIVHVRPPSMAAVTTRLESIFRREQVDFDPDAVRRICELSWGVEPANRAGASAMTAASVIGGDIRSIMVTAEAVVTKWRNENPPSSAKSSTTPQARMSRRWVENCLVGNGASGASGGMTMRTSSRVASSKEIVERVFREHAGISQAELERLSLSLIAAGATSRLEPSVQSASVGAGDGMKRATMERLAQLVDSSGEIDRVVTDLFHTYLTRPFQDDTRLSKPTGMHTYLFFHDQVSSRVHGANHQWELGRYLNLSCLAFHSFFATSAAFANQHAHLGARPTGINGNNPAIGAAHDAARKEHAATVSHLEACMPYPSSSTFRGGPTIVTELVPYLLRMISPDVKIVGARVGGGLGASGGSERATGLGSSTQEKTEDTDISVTAQHIVAVRKASEKTMLAIAVNAALSTGLSFDRIRIDSGPSTKRDTGNHGKDAEEGRFQKERADTDSIGPVVTNPTSWIYRLVPPIDTLTTFGTIKKTISVPVPETAPSLPKVGNKHALLGAGRRPGFGAANAKTNAHAASFHLRRVIETERQREETRRAMMRRKMRQAAGAGTNIDTDFQSSLSNPASSTDGIGMKGVFGSGVGAGGKGKSTLSSRPNVDFFGRPIVKQDDVGKTMDGANDGTKENKEESSREQRRRALNSLRSVAWVKYNDGYSNAVRKSVRMRDFMSGW